MKKSLLIFFAGIFLLGSCSNKEKEAVTGISLDRSELSLVYGESTTLTATVLPHNAANKTVLWNSTVPAIAIVGNHGEVTATGAGKTVISAVTEDGGKTATCNVTVISADVPVTEISLNKSELSLYVGETETLEAKVKPDDATNKTVSWSSNTSTVVTVDVATGKITAVAAGDAVISAVTENGKTATCNVTVIAADVPVTGISLNKSELSLFVGETETLEAKVEPDDATNKTVSWSSNTSTVATVDVATGKITAIAAGNTVISAVTEDGGKIATCNITVNPVIIPVTEVLLDQNTLFLYIGETATLEAKVKPDDATNKTVSWNSNTPTVATVDASTGKITAIAAGNAAISAVTEDGGKVATCNLTVIEPEKENELRVMSFNIWGGGGKSIERTIAAIRASGAGIVGIQEEANSSASRIANSLGWQSVHTYASLLGKACAIISKYPVVAVSTSRIGIKLKVGDGKYVWMFNQHLNHCPYEPYRLNGIEYCGGTLYTEEEAIASAWGARKTDVELTVSEIQKAQTEQIPIFLTGDFNEPSWLDWTERAVAAGLCKIPVAWPATKTLQQQTGMKDSYRTVYPDEVAKPGHTWTPVPATREVMDRIDFVFFWGEQIQVIKSEIVGEKKPESDIVIQSYPSDHRAVISTFQIN